MVNLSHIKTGSAVLQLFCSKNSLKFCCHMLCNEFSNINIFISDLLEGLNLNLNDIM